ncbi:MAG: hypothetical protein J3K34DRAFT_45907 [Monoraphidium minutum]|nr:MAG: hypothetical protein J3K34DRAFT_45907 [Monoraphidium minutum]
MAWEHYDFSGDPRTARAGHSATAVGKYVYVCGGRRGGHFFQDLLRYDTDSHAWETIYEELPFVARANHSATLVEAGPSGGREIWIVGGQTNDDVVGDAWALELDGQLAWRQVHVRDERSLLMRTAHSAELHPRRPNEILVFGGYGGSGEFTFMDSLVALDMATGGVAELKPSGVPPSPRAYHTCTTVGHVLYVFGGRQAGGLVTDGDPTILCAYDAMQNSWRALSLGAGARGQPPCARSSHRAVAFAGRVVIFGGTPHPDDKRRRMGDIHTLYIAPSGDVVWSACDDPGDCDPRPSGAPRSAGGGRMMQLWPGRNANLNLYG